MATCQDGEASSSTTASYMPENSFVRIFLNRYLAGLVLRHLPGSNAIFNLLNVSREIRYNLLKYFFDRYRSISITRDALDTHYPSPHPSLIDIEHEKLKRKMIDTGEWPRKQYFDRFHDFNFEEYVISKIMRIPYWFAPTMDIDYWDQMDGLGTYITKLTLDGTAVTGRGLFGCVNIHSASDVYRSSAGLLSFLAPHLEYLSVMYCRNIQHSDIAIYLLLPPADHVKLGQLKILKAFGCGEAVTEGPFHNIPGYGSRNSVVQKADNILNIRILGLLYPLLLPLDHHRRISVPLSLRMGQHASVKEQRQRLDDLADANWLSLSTLQIYPPPLYLQNQKTGKSVKGPWGGFLSTMHESLMLKSICLQKAIDLDWDICVMGERCASYQLKHLTTVAKINHRTQRVAGVGHHFGNLVGEGSNRKEYLKLENGVIPRVPVALSSHIPGKEGIYLPQPTEKESKAKPKDSKQNYKPRARPMFLSLDGLKPGPDYNDPQATGDRVAILKGLSGEGLHSHSAACLGMRQAKNGKPCANCELWETEHHVYINKKGVRIVDPGRKRWIGELCQLCVPFYTCGDCGDFYCPSCITDPTPGDLPNPWCAVEPSADLLSIECDIHGATCQSCFEANQTGCTGCGKYICRECITNNIADSGWQSCSGCGEYACKDCVEEEILTCPEKAYLEEGHQFCLACLGGMCRFCEEMWCSVCYDQKRRRFSVDHGVKMNKDPKYGCCTCQNCFENQLAWAKTEIERIQVWRYVGVNIIEREKASIQSQNEKSFTKVDEKTGPGDLEDEVMGDGDMNIGTTGKPNESIVTDESAEDDSDAPGVKHLILKKMDETYNLLLEDLKAGGIIVPGVTDLLKNIRTTRNHIERRKAAEDDSMSKRKKRINRKRVKETKKDPDPACAYNPGTFGKAPTQYPDMSTPLPNAGRENSFRWIPSTEDLYYHMEKLNDPESDYYLNDEGLAQLDFIDDEWRKEILKREEIKRVMELERARKLKKRVHWSRIFLPGVQKHNDGLTSGTKRKRASANFHSGDYVYISDTESSGPSRIEKRHTDDTAGKIASNVRNTRSKPSKSLLSQPSPKPDENLRSVRLSLKRLKIKDDTEDGKISEDESPGVSDTVRENVSMNIEPKDVNARGQNTNDSSTT